MIPTYDYLFYGAQFSSLVGLALTSNKGLKSFIVSPDKDLNLQFQSQEAAEVIDWKIIKAENNDSIIFLEKLATELDLNINDLEPRVLDGETFTYSKAKIKPFSGFKDQKVYEKEYLTHLFFNKHLEYSKLSSTIITELHKKFEKNILLQNQITKVEKNEDGYKVTLNDNLVVQTKNIIWCSGKNDLQSSFENILEENKDLSKKISQWKPYAQVNLNFIHNSDDYSQNTGFYNFQDNKCEFDPVYGAFNKTGSQWKTLIPYESVNDSDFCGNALRNMKKLIFRAFPELKETLIKENVSMTYSNLGNTKHIKNFKFKDLDNVYFPIFNLNDDNLFQSEINFLNSLNQNFEIKDEGTSTLVEPSTTADEASL